jgi:hypothetical protein
MSFSALTRIFIKKLISISLIISALIIRGFGQIIIILDLPNGAEEGLVQTVPESIVLTFFAPGHAPLRSWVGCLGDFTGDGAVSVSDLGGFLGVFGSLCE